MKAIALYYLGLLDDVRAAGRAMGYAIGVHGSLSRDFDLIACPWREDAKSAEELAEAVAFAVGGSHRPETVSQKPHGRKAWLIYLPPCGELLTPFIDLSVMPLIKTTGG